SASSAAGETTSAASRRTASRISRSSSVQARRRSSWSKIFILFRSMIHAVAAVEIDGLAGQIRDRCRIKRRDKACELVRGAGAADRYAAVEPALGFLVGQEVAVEVGLDIAGRNVDHADGVTRPFDRETACDRADRGLRGAVSGILGDTELVEERA